MPIGHLHGFMPVLLWRPPWSTPAAIRIIRQKMHSVQNFYFSALFWLKDNLLPYIPQHAPQTVVNSKLLVGQITCT